MSLKGLKHFNLNEITLLKHKYRKLYIWLLFHPRKHPEIWRDWKM